MTTLTLLDAARARLTESADPPPQEALGEYAPTRRILGFARAARIVPRGEAWHLGVLLLTPAAVLATGEIVRSRQEAPRGYTAEAQRRRSEMAAAAFRGGFAEGVAVHVGWHELAPDAVDRGEASGPLALVDGVPHVRWSSTGQFMPLAAYLDERVALLLDPPQGTT